MKLPSNFDELAKNWDSNPDRSKRTQAIADAIREKVPLSPSMNAFEYGCGTGMLSFYLRENLGEIVLADSSHGMLEVLTEKISAAHLTRMQPMHLDLTTDPLPNTKFDLLYTMLTLHHIHDIPLILNQFHTILKPGGHLLIIDLDEEDGSFHNDPSVYVHKGFSREILQSQVETAQFKQVSFSTATTIKKIVEQDETSFPVFLMVAVRK